MINCRRNAALLHAAVLFCMAVLCHAATAGNNQIQADALPQGTMPEVFGQGTSGTYDPYGKVKILAPDGVTVRTASAVGNPWTFTSRRLDGETGLMYYRARYYDVGLGRFIGRDPIGYKGSKDGNLYEYVFGRPVTLLDPLGLGGDNVSHMVSDNDAGYPDAPPYMTTTDAMMGAFYSGLHPGAYNFPQSNPLTQELMTTETVQTAFAAFQGQVAGKCTRCDNSPSTEPIVRRVATKQFAKDAPANAWYVATHDQKWPLENLLGSYDGWFRTDSVDCCNGVVTYTAFVWNVTSVQSATRPPWGSGTSALNPSSGPLKNFTQYFMWRGSYSFPGFARCCPCHFGGPGYKAVPPDFNY